MLLIGKKMVVAERHWKLARHAVSGKTQQITFVPEGRWTFYARLRGRFRRPFRTESLSITVPGTLSLANILSRFATAESFNPLQTLRNLNLIRKIRNEFGHAWRDVGFDSAPVADLSRALPWLGPKEMESESNPRGRFNFAVVILLTDLLWRERLVTHERRIQKKWPNKCGG
jgi:hypothetical protein